MPNFNGDNYLYIKKMYVLKTDNQQYCQNYWKGEGKRTCVCLSVCVYVCEGLNVI